MESIQFGMKVTISCSEESLCQSFYDKRLQKLEMKSNLNQLSAPNNFNMDYYQQDTKQSKFSILPKALSDSMNYLNNDDDLKKEQIFIYEGQPASASSLHHHIFSEPYLDNSEVGDSGYMDTTGKLERTEFCSAKPNLDSTPDNFIVDEEMENTINLDNSFGSLSTKDSSMSITEKKHWQQACYADNVTYATSYFPEMKVNTDGYIERSDNDSKRTGSSADQWKLHFEEQFDFPMCLDRDVQNSKISLVPYLDDGQESNSPYLFDPSKICFQSDPDPEYCVF